MFAALKFSSRRNILVASAALMASALVLLAVGGQALPSADAQPPARAGHAAKAQKAEQPPAKIIVDPPNPDLLAKGVVIVPFRTENVQIVPVFGPAAAKVSPRLGHLHVTLDDATWHWGHTSNDPVIVAPLPPGPHKILIELADADHKVLAKEVVKFEVPQKQNANADKDFLNKVIPAVAASVKVIEYAAKNASDEKVRDFAARVGKQHEESVTTAGGHAKRLGITVVTDPDKDSKAMIDKLSKLKGVDLDIAFLQWVSHSHEDQSVFERQAENGEDAALRTYAKNSVSAAYEHLCEARTILSGIKK